MVWLCRVAVFLGLFVGAREAWATTMVALDVEALVSRSDFIGLVEVEKIDTIRTAGRLSTHVHLRVEERIFGELSERSLRIRLPGGETEDLIQRVAGVPTPEVGERAFVFLEQAGGGFFFPVGLAQGWWTIVGTLSEPRNVLVRRTIEAMLVERDATSGNWSPAPVPPMEEPFVPFLERVRRLVRER